MQPYDSVAKDYFTLVGSSSQSSQSNRGMSAQRAGIQELNSYLHPSGEILQKSPRVLNRPSVFSLRNSVTC